MEQNEKKTETMLSLKQWVHKFPERFPLNYYKMDEEKIIPTEIDSNFLDKYAKCSAYSAKGYLVFMHHFPISKPEMSYEQ